MARFLPEPVRGEATSPDGPALPVNGPAAPAEANATSHGDTRTPAAGPGDPPAEPKPPRTRGRLRVYLGAAPGVGKTYAMLGEGHRRHDRGTDVVIGFVESHDRPRTEAMAVGLEVVPRQRIEYRGSSFTEMDIDATLARHPKVALVDELAHTNVPGSRNVKRWQDVEELLAAGIDVITTVNIQHLESLNDVVQRITGVVQRETVPDAVVRSAEQVDLVDMSPEALRRRMAHGNVYAPEKVDAALGNYFRVGNLTALRELALLWLADQVDDALEKYRADHGITDTWEARERVVVALTGGPEGEALIRRGARIAARTGGGEILAVHVSRSDGLVGSNPANLQRQRRLVESLGGSYHQVIGDDVATALIEFARAENATQLVIGASRHNRFATLLAGSVGATVVRLSGPIDVHIVTHAHAASRRGLPSLQGGLTLRRRLLGLAVAAIGLPALTLLLGLDRQALNLTSDVLLFLLWVIVVALVGGLAPALIAALVASALLNYYFTPPLYAWTIGEPNNALALIVFVVAAMLVSSVVDLAARRTVVAARASAESQMLATLAGTVLRGGSALPALLDQVREAFGLTAVTLLERAPGPSTAVSDWKPVVTVGADACTGPDDCDAEVPIGQHLLLAVKGRTLAAHDRRILDAVAAQAATALEQQRLTDEAAAARPHVEADRMRTALLAAVSHDLRTPLTSAKAAVSSLLSTDLQLAADEQRELLHAADISLDRLDRLVADLLDMSRLQAGALSTFPRRIALDELVPLALDQLGDAGLRVALDVAEDLPPVTADPTLLERVLVNLTANALRYSPPDQSPRITGSHLEDRVELRVIDRGPGIAEQDRERVFAPFQRLGDTDNTTGVGLGLAVARGLTEAMNGTLEPEETPGGGLTMVITLPAAARLDTAGADLDLADGDAAQRTTPQLGPAPAARAEDTNGGGTGREQTP
jgi:two-component system, OmpR family, sensor histidine kinase KdpD